jgi:hypothetical protein
MVRRVWPVLPPDCLLLSHAPSLSGYAVLTYAPPFSWYAVPQPQAPEPKPRATTRSR